MRKVALLLFTFYFLLPSVAQTDVTKKYIDNPDFEARFAGWENNGMLFQTNNSFKKKNGMVYMEKYVSQGSTVGSSVSIRQKLVGLTPGTYTLTAGAQNIKEKSTDKQSGAFVFAGDQQVEVVDSAEYAVTFTVVTGEVEIGFKTAGATGNWVSIDNFRLQYEGLVEADIHTELQKLITEAESVLGNGNTAAELQTAINEAKALLTVEGDYQSVAKALERATLNYRISNGTGTIPTVTTHYYVPTGVTIALGRLTATGSGIKERGFCWSTEPNPTILDNRSTRYFSNNGNIYCMEHMKAATIYYVRAYALTSNWQVGYGDVVKIATLPKSNVTTWYDNAGDEETNYRIASAVNEVEWLYHNLTNVRDFNLSVHYSPGSGAGGGTADCSYGGYMRVSQNTPYQQTGTILHETNHGVGVGTTNEWYNNAHLRAETSRGLWLGPRATQMVRFLDNSETATLTGDATHMWPYGINGAHEDSYNPENTILYYANAMTTHALHQDGLICSRSVGFATPAYVFMQDDNQKYYLRSEDTNNTGFLTLSATGTLRTDAFDADKADNFAWNITYDPATSYYRFYNVGKKKYITFSNSKFSTKSTSTPSSNEAFHLLPARQNTTLGDFTGLGYWIVKSGTALTAATTTTANSSYDMANSATNQRWMFLTEDEMASYNAESTKQLVADLDVLIGQVQTALATPHTTKNEADDVNEVDGTLNNMIEDINNQKASYSQPSQPLTAINNLQKELVQFLTKVKVTDVTKPIDISCLLVNPGLDTDCNGWSVTTTNSNSLCEFYESTFDFNQTTAQKLPAGTYELRVQAFQRLGAAADSYTDFKSNGSDNVNVNIYMKTKTSKIKNIWEDAQSKSLGGTTSKQGSMYVPSNMMAARKWFDAGHYDNSVMLTTTSSVALKLGIKSSGAQGSAYWVTFDNFRLLYYGDHSIEYITPVEGIEADTQTGETIYHDLAGRRVTKPTKQGIYIRNGHKVVIK